MTTASLELSKELYELSGWDLMDKYYSGNGTIIPANDLGYLLRKLPIMHPETKMFAKRQVACWGEQNGWHAYWITDDQEIEISSGAADTPENAACKLAIELFKAGVLTKEGTK